MIAANAVRKGSSTTKFLTVYIFTKDGKLKIIQSIYTSKTKPKPFVHLFEK